MILPELLPFRFVGENPAVVVGGGQLGGGGFVHNHRAAGMQLQGGGGNHRRDRAFDGFGNDLGFARAGGQQQAPTAFQNRAHSHRDRTARDVLGAAKKGGVLLDGDRTQGLDPSARTQSGQ